MSREQSLIRLPFLIINDPLARRVALPLTGIIWLVYLIISCIVILTILNKIWGNTAELLPSLLGGVLFLTVAGVIFATLNILIKRIFYITFYVEKDRITYSTGLDKYRRIFDLKNAEKILCIKTYDSKTAIYLVRQGERDVLIDKFGLVFGESNWERFTRELSNITQLPLETMETNTSSPF